MSREAMQMALEALESDPISHAGLVSRKQAITALRERLAQPEQEPIATVESVATVVSESGNQEITMSWWHEPALSVGTKHLTKIWWDLNKHKLVEQAIPEAEIYKREWVGLTDDDIHDAFNFTEMVKQLSWDREPEQWCKNFAAYIEAKLKEKNT